MRVRSAIIGSSTGIGRALVKLHREQGIECVAFSRKPEQMEGVVGIQLDLTNGGQAGEILRDTFREYPEIETVYLVSGTGDVEATLDYELAQSTMALNCNGFTLAAYCAAEYFEERGFGGLVAVTSVAAIRGGGKSLSYNASKAYQSSLLEGLRCRFTGLKKAIAVTEVRAGFVDTAMMKADKPFWVATARQAAEAMMTAGRSGKNLVYVLGRWRIVGWLLTVMPV